MNVVRVCTLSLCLASSSAVVSAQEALSDVSINGVPLTQAQKGQLEQSIGVEVLPGRYLVNFLNGCWMNVDTGAQGCTQAQTGIYNSRYGSGERYSDGSWSHYSNIAGGGVGGTADGCIYAGDWSNC